ncbi:MAG: M48 family metalloprotease, partial [Cohaesibacteraceae bacterium]
TSTISATRAGASSMLGNLALFFCNNRNFPLGIVGVLLAMIVAPMAAMLVQMAISRTREFAADKLAAEICGRPDWLASALARIGELAGRAPLPTAERNPATAHLFIANPLSGSRFAGLFATHPPMEQRIAKLNDLSVSWGDAPLTQQPAPMRGEGSRPSPWDRDKRDSGGGRDGPWG